MEGGGMKVRIKRIEWAFRIWAVALLIASGLLTQTQINNYNQRGRIKEFEIEALYFIAKNQSKNLRRIEAMRVRVKKVFGGRCE